MDVHAIVAYLQDNPALLGTFVCSVVAYYISALVFPLLPAYKRLSVGDKAEWNSRVVSNIHAVVTTYGALKVLSTNVYEKFPYTAWSKDGEFYANVLLGYLAYDLLLCLQHKQLRTPSTFVHHFLGLFSYSIVNYTQNAQYIAMLWIATELTTPLVNFRWFLAASKMNNSVIYTLNGALMTLAFLLWRVIIIPGCAIYTLYHFGYQIKMCDPLIQPLIPLSLPAITILNMYWTYLMLRGLAKKLLQKPATKKS